MFYLIALLSISWAIASFAEVNVREAMRNYIYDTSLKIHIHGTGFDVDQRNIVLELSPNGQPPLVIGKDYSITKIFDGDGIILHLIENRKLVIDIYLS
jgi:hypothetical protein